MIIDDSLLDNVTAQAAASPRLRMNHNLHHSLDAKAQRLINVLLPGTVIPIHRHTFTDETYIILRGKIRVNFLNNQKEVTESFTLSPGNGSYGLQIPMGQWHSLDVLEPSAIFEVKDGPYTPISPDDILQ
ncbi:MAG: WbuC family cupin fold metalloprotein [Pseudoflavonifractor sp.]|nr:WbuC family cupin fold metalloprotein [Alloprevotella sp.]MCM1116071.1 WbuC family cupin fold metalloprotein [Pseudoflavonifractor sp.]